MKDIYLFNSSSTISPFSLSLSSFFLSLSLTINDWPGKKLSNKNGKKKKQKGKLAIKTNGYGPG
jgi:hypothetical protein